MKRRESPKVYSLSLLLFGVRQKKTFVIAKAKRAACARVLSNNIQRSKVAYRACSACYPLQYEIRTWWGNYAGLDADIISSYAIIYKRL